MTDDLTKPAAQAGTIGVGDLTVNRLGFGAMRVCGPQIWGEPANRTEALKLLRRAYDLGHTLFDTADSYGPHVSELLIAEALHPYPKGLVIGTKGGLLRPNRHAWDPNGRPGHLRSAVDGSLKRLKLECIDLYQLHAPDPKVPFTESVGALAQMQRAGKVRHLGLSNVSVAQLEDARRIAPIVSVQNRFNLEDRSSDDVLAACEKLGIAFLPWYPLSAGSSLTSAKVKTLAKKLGATPSQVVLAWLLKKSPVMLPIPGTGSVEHLEENMQAASLELGDADFRML